MVPLATRLAEGGAVVFVPTYHTDLTTSAGQTRTGDDIGCAYRLARRRAEAYGGDLTRPMTVVGWSLGADIAVYASLGPPDDSRAARCPGNVARPDVVVGVSGCYYRSEGRPVTWFADLTGWAPPGTVVRLVAGNRDTTCPASQTDALAGALRTHGYDVAVTHLGSADHGAPVFRAERAGRDVILTDDPAGDRTVRVVEEAIATASAASD